MDFHKKINRLTHPQASRIPEWCWRYFDFDLNDNLIELMSAPTDAGFVERIRKFLPFIKENNQDIKQNGRISVFLALSFSHPDLSIKQLDKIGRMLELTVRNKYEIAIFSGNLPYLKHLEHKYKKVDAPKSVEKLIDAAVSNQLEILQYLAKKAKKQLQEIIADNNFLVFKAAAVNGHLEVLHYLAAQAPEQLQEMIAADGFYAFKMAAANGNLEVLHYLVAQAPEQLKNMIAADSFYAFRKAAENGNLEVLHYLAAQAPEQLQGMIAVDSFYAFRKAAENGNLEVLHYLAAQTPEQLKNMIAADSFYAFRRAIENGNLEVLHYLAAQAPEQLQEMITAKNFGAFRLAVQNKHCDVINYLLSHHSVFAYAEQNEGKYGNHITLFLTEKLASLRLQKKAAELVNPNTVFNIENPDESRLLSYCLQYLIRHNDPSSQNDISFLRAIPAVRELAEANKDDRGQSLKTGDLPQGAVSMRRAGAGGVCFFPPGLPAEAGPSGEIQGAAP